MKKENIEALVQRAVDLVIDQFPSATNNVFIQDYKNSGKIKALKDLLAKKLLLASENKGLVTLISKSGTLWSDLFYLLSEIGIDYCHIVPTKAVSVDFGSMTLDIVDT